MNAAASPAEQVRGIEPRAWSAPQIEGAAVTATRGRKASEEQREEEQRIRVAAEAAGRAEGMAAVQREMAARLATLDEATGAARVMLEALSRPLAQLDDQVHEQIALLAVRIARAVVRRELRMDPTQVIGIVRDTVALLPASTRGPRVVLNPQDASLVRERMAPAGPEAAWSIIEDPMLARGDCRVHTDHAQVDARLDTRLNEALAALIGEERAHERGGGAA